MQLAETANEHELVACRDPQYRQQSKDGAERDALSASDQRHQPADERQWQGQQRQNCQAPVVVGRVQQQQDSDYRDRGEGKETVPRRSLLFAVVENFRMVFERELELTETRLDVSHHRAGVTSSHIDTDVHVARNVFLFDQAWSWHEARLRHIAKAHGHFEWRVNQQVVNRGQIVSSFWRTPDHHVEHFLFFEQTAYLDSIHQR